MAKKTVTRTTEDVVYEVSHDDWMNIVAMAMTEDKLLDEMLHEKPELMIVIGHMASVFWHYLTKYNGDTNEEDSDGTEED